MLNMNDIEYECEKIGKLSEKFLKFPILKKSSWKDTHIGIKVTQVWMELSVNNLISLVKYII